jgi:hypothetical protein
MNTPIQVNPRPLTPELLSTTHSGMKSNVELGKSFGVDNSELFTKHGARSTVGAIAGALASRGFQPHPKTHSRLTDPCSLP